MARKASSEAIRMSQAAASAAPAPTQAPRTSAITGSRAPRWPRRQFQPVRHRSGRPKRPSARAEIGNVRAAGKGQGPLPLMSATRTSFRRAASAAKAMSARHMALEMALRRSGLVRTSGRSRPRWSPSHRRKTWPLRSDHRRDPSGTVQEATAQEKAYSAPRRGGTHGGEQQALRRGERAGRPRWSHPASRQVPVRAWHLEGESPRAACAAHARTNTPKCAGTDPETGPRDRPPRVTRGPERGGAKSKREWEADARNTDKRVIA